MQCTNNVCSRRNSAKLNKHGRINTAHLYKQIIPVITVAELSAIDNIPSYISHIKKISATCMHAIVTFVHVRTLCLYSIYIQCVLMHAHVTYRIDANIMCTCFSSSCVMELFLFWFHSDSTALQNCNCILCMYCVCW